MKSVYMVMHQKKIDIHALATVAIQACLQEKLIVSVEPWVYAILPTTLQSKLAQEPIAKCEAIIALGGDGTLLRANRMALAQALPVLGINVGNVGFLTEIELPSIGMAAKCMAADDFFIDERMMLQSTIGHKTHFALNDFVLSRGGYARLIGVNVWVGEEHVGRYNADGLIVATPTGSTGYSLSAGGPVVSPLVQGIILTPISAHSLQHRPVMVSAQQTVRIELDERYHHSALLSIDGVANKTKIGYGDTLYIQKAEKCAKFIRIKPLQFFATVRKKLTEWSL